MIGLELVWPSRETHWWWVLTVQSTLGFLLKYQDDVDKLRGQVAELLQEA